MATPISEVRMTQDAARQINALQCQLGTALRAFASARCSGDERTLMTAADVRAVYRDAASRVVVGEGPFQGNQGNQ